MALFCSNFVTFHTNSDSEFYQANFIIESIIGSMNKTTCSEFFNLGSLGRTQNLEILSLKGTSHRKSDSEWENERFFKRI
jgi:hypothetical protein